MKKIIYIIIIAILAIAQNSFSQRIGDLDGIFYQAVALEDEPKELVGMDLEAKPLYNREIGVKFTITKGLNGDIQWEETHVDTTDKYGLFTLIIGQGNVTSTAYAALLDIPWIDADQFLKVEISTQNDGNYKLVSNQKFMAVPYAFYTDDIADRAIDLNTKIADVDPKQILIGDTAVTGPHNLKTLAGGDGVTITQTPDSVIIESPPVAIGADGTFPVNINKTLGPNEAWYSPDNLQIGPVANKPFEMGDIFLASADVDLQGCILSVSMKDIVGGKAKLEVIIFNPGNNPNTPTFTSATLKFLLVK